MNLLELHPSPYEVALARVPAGMTVRAHRGENRGPLRDPIELAADEYTRYVQVPGTGVAWGAIWSTWYAVTKVDNNRHKRDRRFWQKAARRLAGPRDDASPVVVYVAHEQLQERGRTVWAAVSIREEEADLCPNPGT